MLKVLIQWRRRGGAADIRAVVAERGADAPDRATLSFVAWDPEGR